MTLKETAFARFYSWKSQPDGKAVLHQLVLLRILKKGIRAEK